MSRQDFAFDCSALPGRCRIWRASLQALALLLSVAFVPAAGACKKAGDSERERSGAQGQTADQTADQTAGAASGGAGPCTSQADCQAACARCTGDCPPAAATACYDLAKRLVSDPASLDAPLDLPAVAAAYRSGCDGGHTESCAALGLMVQDGRGAKRDLEAARGLYQKACDGGRGVGCFNLGLMYGSGTAGSIDVERANRHFAEAAERYKKSCDRGELAWCMNLGVLYENGYGQKADHERSLTIYRDACGRGHGDSCVNWSLQELYGRGVPADPSSAVRRLRATCAGEREFLACGVLGQVLSRGFPGVERAPTEAVKHLTRGCGGGVKQACFMLAAMHGMGDGLTRDPEKERAALSRACQLGSADSCYMIAEIEYGKEDDASLLSAREYYGRACAIGHGEGCAKSAALAEQANADADSPAATRTSGDQPDIDKAEIMARYTDSCRLGFAPACGVLIERGVALPLPEKRALIMYESACRQGIDKACERVQPDGL